MITQAEIKDFALLKQKKYREQTGMFLGEGYKIVEEAVISNYPTQAVLYTEKGGELYKSLIAKLKKADVPTEVVSHKVLEKIADTQTPQEILGVYKRVKKNVDELLAQNSGAVIGFDMITDPGNAGTILRTADWFNYSSVISLAGSVDLFSPKVVRSSMGSLFRLSVVEGITVKEIVRIAAQKNFTLVCSVLGGEDYRKVKLPKNSLLFFSNESRGVSPELLTPQTLQIAIPGKGRAESLNVSSAAAILLAGFAL